MGSGWEKSSLLGAGWLTRIFSGQLSGEGLPGEGAAWYPLGREKHNLKVENYCVFSFCCCFLNYYSYFLSFKNLFFNFWPPHGMQGIEPALSGVEVRSLNCWTTREV